MRTGRGPDADQKAVRTTARKARTTGFRVLMSPARSLSQENQGACPAVPCDKARPSDSAKASGQQAGSGAVCRSHLMEASPGLSRALPQESLGTWAHAEFARPHQNLQHALLPEAMWQNFKSGAAKLQAALEVFFFRASPSFFTDSRAVAHVFCPLCLVLFWQAPVAVPCFMQLLKVFWALVRTFLLHALLSAFCLSSELLPALPGRGSRDKEQGQIKDQNRPASPRAQVLYQGIRSSSPCEPGAQQFFTQRSVLSVFPLDSMPRSLPVSLAL